MVSEFMDGFLKNDEKKDEPAATISEAMAEGATGLKADAIAVLQSIYDPEIPVNIYELGLIYDLEVDEASREVRVLMTLTTPMCPVAESMPGEVESRLRDIEGVGEIIVDLTWEPPWGPERMSEAAKLELGML
jgi:FeS assembly SUF system protein